MLRMFGGLSILETIYNLLEFHHALKSFFLHLSPERFFLQEQRITEVSYKKSNMLVPLWALSNKDIARIEIKVHNPIHMGVVYSFNNWNDAW